MPNLSPPSASTPAPAFDPVRDARPGDVRVYARTSLFNWVIRIKTWSRFTHVEAVAEVFYDQQTGEPIGHTVFGSRNGRGVAFYPGVPEDVMGGLALVLRPEPELDPAGIAAANLWARDCAIGQGYDWVGLLNFTYARWVGRDNKKMFCSEALTRWLRRCGKLVFPEHDADTIAPRDFTVTGGFRVVYRSADEWERYNAWVSHGGYEGE